MKVSAAFSGPVDIDVRPEVVLLTARCQVGEGGELVPVQSAKRAWAGKLLPEAGRTVSVVVTRERMRRSSPANRYLFGWVYSHIIARMRQIAAEAGEPCALDVAVQQLRAAGILIQGEPATPSGLLHERMVRKHLPGCAMVADLGFLGSLDVGRSRVLDGEQFQAFTESIVAEAARKPLYLTICETEGGHEDGCPMLGRAA